jgi:hypothetical protein
MQYIIVLPCSTVQRSCTRVLVERGKKGETGKETVSRSLNDVGCERSPVLKITRMQTFEADEQRDMDGIGS